MDSENMSSVSNKIIEVSKADDGQENADRIADLTALSEKILDPHIKNNSEKPSKDLIQREKMNEEDENDETDEDPIEARDRKESTSERLNKDENSTVNRIRNMDRYDHDYISEVDQIAKEILSQMQLQRVYHCECHYAFDPLAAITNPIGARSGGNVSSENDLYTKLQL